MAEVSLTSPPTAAAAGSKLFESFAMGGFESACHINALGCRLDMLAQTQHDLQAEEDFARLKDFGIRVVRENVRWHLIDRGGQFDFAPLESLVTAARRQGMQVIWSLCHYGWPDALDLFAPDFVTRFAAYTREVVRYIGERSDLPPLYSPFNEMSFVAYAVGARGFMYPYTKGKAHEVKCQLVRATIAATEAVWETDPRARLVHIDPVFNVVPPRDHPELQEAADGMTRSQYQAADMITGEAFPELGGHPAYLDVIGLNYYHANQWEWPENRLRWEDTPRDERWIPFATLLARAQEHYRRPMFVAETSHFGIGRASWFHEATDEVCNALEAGVPLQGMCVYPVLDRPDWEDLTSWHNSGLWDLVDEGGVYRRVLHEPYAKEVRRMIALTAPIVEARQQPAVPELLRAGGLR